MCKLARVLLSLGIVMALGSSVWAEDAASAASDGLKPGDVLNQTNWQQAEALLPPEILKHYRTGEYVNRIVEWKNGAFNWPPNFVEASKKNEGRFAIGKEGQILDKATNQQPPVILGFPFPNIDPQDPQAGVKTV